MKSQVLKPCLDIFKSEKTLLHSFLNKQDRIPDSGAHFLPGYNCFLLTALTLQNRT